MSAMKGVVSGNSDENANVGTALVSFRVRGESLGHGESVYLVPEDNPSGLRVSSHNSI